MLICKNMSAKVGQIRIRSKRLEKNFGNEGEGEEVLNKCRCQTC